jgi:hypothetical protein
MRRFRLEPTLETLSTFSGDGDGDGDGQRNNPYRDSIETPQAIHHSLFAFRVLSS